MGLSGQSQRTDPVVRKWCATYGLGATAQFDTDLYSEDGARRLCQEWVNSLSHYFLLWQEAGADLLWQYPLDQLGSYRESEDFTRWANANLTKPKAAARLAKLREIRPKPPKAM